MLMDFHDFHNRDSFDEAIKMRDNNPILHFKTACFVKYLGSMLIDFDETSITGILLMRWSK